jgi:hypothetical protein
MKARYRCRHCPAGFSWPLDMWEHLTRTGHGRLAP